MNRKELIDALVTRTSSSEADADRAISALIDIISGTLEKGDSLSRVGFGSFEGTQACCSHRPQSQDWRRTENQVIPGASVQGRGNT